MSSSTPQALPHVAVVTASPGLGCQCFLDELCRACVETPELVPRGSTHEMWAWTPHSTWTTGTGLFIVVASATEATSCVDWIRSHSAHVPIYLVDTRACCPHDEGGILVHGTDPGVAGATQSAWGAVVLLRCLQRRGARGAVSPTPSSPPRRLAGSAHSMSALFSNDSGAEDNDSSYSAGDAVEPLPPATRKRPRDASDSAPQLSLGSSNSVAPRWPAAAASDAAPAPRAGSTNGGAGSSGGDVPHVAAHAAPGAQNSRGARALALAQGRERPAAPAPVGTRRYRLKQNPRRQTLPPDEVLVAVTAGSQMSLAAESRPNDYAAVEVAASFGPPLADLGLTPSAGLDPWNDHAVANGDTLDGALQAALSSDPQLLPLLFPRASRAACAPLEPESDEARRWKSLALAVAVHARESAVAFQRRGIAGARDLQHLLGSPRRLSRRMFRVVATMPTGGTPARPTLPPRALAVSEVVPRGPASTTPAAGAAHVEFAPPSCSAWRLAPGLPRRALQILDRLRRAYWAAVVGCDGVSDAPAGIGPPDPGALSTSRRPRDAVLDAAVSHGLLDPLRFFTHALPAALTMLAALHLGGDSDAGVGEGSVVSSPSLVQASATAPLIAPALRTPAKRGAVHRSIGGGDNCVESELDANRGGAVAADNTCHAGLCLASGPRICGSLEAFARRTDIEAWWPGSLTVLSGRPAVDDDRQLLPSHKSGPLPQLGLVGAAALCHDFLADMLVLPLNPRPAALPVHVPLRALFDEASTTHKASGDIGPSIADEDASLLHLRARVLPKRPRGRRHRSIRGSDTSREDSTLDDPIVRMPLRLVVLQLMMRLQIAAMESAELPADARDSLDAPTSAPFLDEYLRKLVDSAAATVCLLSSAELARVAFLASTGEASQQRALLVYACRAPFGVRLPRVIAALYEAVDVHFDDVDASAASFSGAKRAAFLAALDRSRAGRARCPPATGAGGGGAVDDGPSTDDWRVGGSLQPQDNSGVPGFAMEQLSTEETLPPAEEPGSSTLHGQLAAPEPRQSGAGRLGKGATARARPGAAFDPDDVLALDMKRRRAAAAATLQGRRWGGSQRPTVIMHTRKTLTSVQASQPLSSGRHHAR